MFSRFCSREILFWLVEIKFFHFMFVDELKLSMAGRRISRTIEMNCLVEFPFLRLPDDCFELVGAVDRYACDVEKRFSGIKVCKRNKAERDLF